MDTSSSSPLLASLDLIESLPPALKGRSYEQEFSHQAAQGFEGPKLARKHSLHLKNSSDKTLHFASKFFNCQ